MGNGDDSFGEATSHFRKLVQEQVERVARISKPAEWLDYSRLE